MHAFRVWGSGFTQVSLSASTEAVDLGMLARQAFPFGGLELDS